MAFCFFVSSFVFFSFSLWSLFLFFSFLRMWKSGPLLTYATVFPRYMQRLFARICVGVRCSYILCIVDYLERGTWIARLLGYWLLPWHPLVCCSLFFVCCIRHTRFCNLSDLTADYFVLDRSRGVWTKFNLVALGGTCETGTLVASESGAQFLEHPQCCRSW